MSKYFEKAGAIIIRDNDDKKEILLEYRGRKYFNDWSFPKGGIDAGETPEETTMREVKEETGMEIEILSTLPTIYYQNKHDGDVRQYMFLAKAINSHLMPEFKYDKAEWTPLEDVIGKLSYQNLKDYFAIVESDLEAQEIP